MRHTQVGLVAAAVLALGVAPAQAAGLHGYAESMYAEYAAGTGNRITFDVKALDTGSMKQIADTSFDQLVSTTNYLIDADQFGTEFRAPRFIAPYDSRGFDAFMSMELKNTPRGFETMAGRSLNGGIYRKLAVSATIGSETRQHQALEFCWAVEGFCTVLDPTVIFMDSMAQSRIRLKAQGWGPQKAEEMKASGEMGTTAVCGLASNPAYIGKSLTWGAWWIEYKNIYGGVLVRKDLGAQQAGVRCDSSCNPAPYGYSNFSSCQSFLGWSCACDNEFGYGQTNKTGKWISETKCAHKFAFSASASASVSNFGSASVSINWTMDGSTDANGGYYMDTCGYF